MSEMPYLVTNKPQTIIPMKPLSEAKSRLKGNVDSMSRRAAILMMLDKVIKAVKQDSKTDCIVLGGDNFIQKLANLHNVQWSPDPSPNNGLNDCLWKTMIKAHNLGSKATLFLPGDLPLISTSDIDQIFLASDSLRKTVIARAVKDGGTNAMLQPAAQSFKPMLGNQSFSKHKKQILKNSIPLSIIETPGLQFDLDNDSDYEWAIENVNGFNNQIDDWISWIAKASNKNCSI